MQIDEVTPPSPALRHMRGSETIANALREVSFPISKVELMARLTGATLDFGETRAALSEIIRGIPQAKFQDAGQAHREVNTRWLRITKSLAAVEQLENAER